jgi:hypothetical protein
VAYRQRLPEKPGKFCLLRLQATGKSVKPDAIKERIRLGSQADGGAVLSGRSMELVAYEF